MVKVTATKVAFDDMAVMYENGWEMVCWSEARQAAVMWKRTDSEIKDDLPVDLQPKRGEKVSKIDPAPPIETPNLQPND